MTDTMTATATDEETGVECPVCGATENSHGRPLTEGSRNQHMSRQHPEEWAVVQAELGRDGRTRDKAPREDGKRGPGRPPKSAARRGRHDLSGGVTANMAMGALLVGARNPWKGQVLTSFAGQFGTDLNASAQAGPDWWYQAVEMASAGGVHMAAAFDVLAIVVLFRAEKDPRARGFVPSLRAMGLPVPQGPWESGGSSVPPPRPAPGPVTVDVDPPSRPPATTPVPPMGGDMLATLLGQIDESDLAKAAEQMAGIFGMQGGKNGPVVTVETSEEIT